MLPASVSEVLDSGVTNANTTTFTYAGLGSLTHQVNTLNAIGLSVSARSQSFNYDGSLNSTTNNVLTPNTYLTAGQSWIHNVNPRTNLTLAASTGWFIADGVESNDSVSESVTLQVQTAFSERLNFTAGGGGNVVRTSGETDPTNGGFIADAALNSELATATISAFASHNLAPSSLGEIQERTQAGFSVAHAINEWSGVVFSGAFAYQLPVASLPANSNRDQQHQALVLSVGYHRILAENWNLGLRYSFTQQNNSDDGFFWDLNEGSSTSNAVFATITRNFSLLGGPLSGAPGEGLVK